MKNKHNREKQEDSQFNNNEQGASEPISEHNENTVPDELVDDAPPTEPSIEEKLAEVNDKYLRLAAEFDNFRKRNARERLDLIVNAGEEVIKGLLPIVDDLERAIEAGKTANDVQVLQEGTQLIYDKFMNYLRGKGLACMDVLGKELDTDLCDAISKYPAPDETLKNKIINVVQPGYTLNGKVIRHAKVVMGE